MDTQPAPHGINKREIIFPNGNQAQAILPPDGTRTSDLLHALGLQQPDAVIIIAGGASEMDEQAHPDLVRLFTDGIAQTAASVKALIIDGGTQAGVMAIMGQAVAEQQRRSPLLGIAPAGGISYPGKSTDLNGNEGAPLEPNHSHFVLVASDEWGSETATMYELAEMLSAGHPSVAVLVNGGSIAKGEVMYNVRQRRPIIVIEGSGRFADELARLWQEKPSFIPDPQLDELARLWQEKPSFIPDPQLAEIVLHTNIYVFPITGSAAELVQLTKRLLEAE